MVPLKHEKGERMTKITKKSKRKLYKEWGDKDSKFYNGSTESLLQDNNIEVCSSIKIKPAILNQKNISILLFTITQKN